jgi:hypothetical protein
MATVFECASLRPESDLGWWAGYRASVDEHDAPGAWKPCFCFFFPNPQRGSGLGSSTVPFCFAKPYTNDPLVPIPTCWWSRRRELSGSFKVPQLVLKSGNRL